MNSRRRGWPRYLGVLIGALIVLQTLVLDTYRIAIHGSSLVLVGGLICAAVAALFQQTDIHHIRLNTIFLSGRRNRHTKKVIRG